MKIGTVIAASVISGIEAKLDLENPEDLKVGYPVIIEGKKYDFYCIVKDVYNPSSEIIEKVASVEDVERLMPISMHNPSAIFSRASLRAIQIIDKADNRLCEPETIPQYLAQVRMAEKEDVEKIYIPTRNSMSIGSLRGVADFEIQIDFDRLTEKPFGIFGRTGVGKSILCKIICNSILAKNISSVLIFDMHGEYGIFSKTDSTQGIKYFFPESVEMFALEHSSNKDAKPFLIDSREIRVEDIIVAFQDLTPPMIDTLYIINKKRTQPLLTAIKDATAEEYETIHPSALQALQRRISRLDRFEFVREGSDTFAQLLGLIKARKSIVLDFGKYGRDAMAYLFLANIIGRRLYDEYSEKEYPRLVIFLEEAHKFLAPEVAHYSIFERLARETRKFNLILALIDQRPSRISEEVRSQLANRLILSIKESGDASAALEGVSDRAVWQGIIGTMPLRTVLVLGDAIRVPTVIDVMDYKKIKFSLPKTNIEDIDEIAKQSEKIFSFK